MQVAVGITLALGVPFTNPTTPLPQPSLQVAVAITLAVGVSPEEGLSAISNDVALLILVFTCVFVAGYAW